MAVLAVLCAHFPAIEGFELSYLVKAAASGLRIGYLGVDIFFVLSGFLITSILLREKERGTLSFSRFYAKRALRIFPIFYLSLVAVFLLFDVSARELLFNALYLSNYYYVFETDASPLRHTWSLSVEEQFYLFWPLVVAMCPGFRLGRFIVGGLLVVLALSAVLSFAVLDYDQFHRFTVRALPFRMLSLGIGAYIAWNPALLDSVPVRYPALAIIACPILILSLYGSTGAFMPLLDLFAMSVWSVSIFLFVSIGAKQKLRFVTLLFESRPMVYVGRISYGIYLYHYIILSGLGVLSTNAYFAVEPVEFVVPLVLTFLVASLSFHVVERPFLRIKSRLAQQSS